MYCFDVLQFSFDVLQFGSVCCVADLGSGESTAPHTKYEYVLCIVLMCCSLVLCIMLHSVVYLRLGKDRVQDTEYGCVWVCMGVYGCVLL